MKIKKLLLAFAAVVSLTSCNFTESINLNKDGSGNYSLDMDASQLMAMVPKDSVGKSEKIDSTFTFKELFDKKKDSISKLSPEEQQKLKSLMNFAFGIKMNTDEKQFVFSVKTDFKSVAELHDAMATIDELQKMNKNKNANIPSSGLSNPNLKLSYVYDGKKFTRTGTVDPKAKTEKIPDSLDQYKMILESSKYAIKYHFPDKIKKVSNKDAVISEDKQTVTIEYPFLDYTAKPDILNFTVEFEK